MSETKLVEDAYRLTMDLWNEMDLPNNVVVTVEEFSEEGTVGEITARRGRVDYWIRLNPAYIKTGRDLFAVILHELLHAMDSDMEAALVALALPGGIPESALHMLTEAEEGFVIRLERFLTKLMPCPEWLVGSTYGEAGDDAAR